MAKIRFLIAALLLGSLSLNAGITLDQMRDLSHEEIERMLPKEHPSNYMLYSARLFREDKVREATKWYYVGALRFTIYLKTNPTLPADGDPAVYESLVNQLYTTVTTSYSGSFKEWSEAIMEALVWDETHENAYTDRVKEAKTYNYIRKRVEKEAKRLAELKRNGSRR